jgi:hypothetical protein
VQPLIDNILIDCAFVFDNDGAAVLVQAEGIDTSAMNWSGGVLAGQKPHAQDRLEVVLKELLK